MTPERCTEARAIALDSKGLSASEVAREYAEPQLDEAIVFSFFSDRLGLSLTAKIKVNPDDSTEEL
jgi:hypothetical protein